MSSYSIVIHECYPTFVKLEGIGLKTYNLQMAIKHREVVMRAFLGEECFLSALPARFLTMFSFTVSQWCLNNLTKYLRITRKKSHWYLLLIGLEPSLAHQIRSWCTGVAAVWEVVAGLSQKEPMGTEAYLFLYDVGLSRAVISLRQTWQMPSTASAYLFGDKSGFGSGGLVPKNVDYDS
uniref:SFRICE_015171 n=1 Tax=Spodoptera frugiperda TaxID=7108 RepID=A0A2H1VRB3_SPOFR